MRYFRFDANQVPATIHSGRCNRLFSTFKPVAQTQRQFVFIETKFVKNNQRSKLELIAHRSITQSIIHQLTARMTKLNHSRGSKDNSSTNLTQAEFF